MVQSCSKGVATEPFASNAIAKVGAKPRIFNITFLGLEGGGGNFGICLGRQKNLLRLWCGYYDRYRTQ